MTHPHLKEQVQLENPKLYFFILIQYFYKKFGLILFTDKAGQIKFLDSRNIKI